MPALLGAITWLMLGGAKRVVHWTLFGPKPQRDPTNQERLFNSVMTMLDSENWRYSSMNLVETNDYKAYMERDWPCLRNKTKAEVEILSPLTEKQRKGKVAKKLKAIIQREASKWLRAREEKHMTESLALLQPNNGRLFVNEEKSINPSVVLDLDAGKGENLPF